MTDSPVLQLVPLGMPWPTVDPFLFCVHHLDAYPAGPPGPFEFSHQPRVSVARSGPAWAG